jgi:hypothetical protein
VNVCNILLVFGFFGMRLAVFFVYIGRPHNPTWEQEKQLWDGRVHQTRLLPPGKFQLLIVSSKNLVTLRTVATGSVDGDHSLN